MDVPKRASKKEGERLIGGSASLRFGEATRNPEAYRLFLRASEVLHKRDYARAKEAIAWLEEAIRLDPSFVRAESQLALVHAAKPDDRLVENLLAGVRNANPPPAPP